MKKNNGEVELNLIGSETSIEGNIISQGELRINGKVKGNVTLSGPLFVGESGFIEGDIHSENTILSGQIKGNIESKNKVILERTSKFYGELKCTRLIVEDGAVFEGSSMMKNETLKPKDG